MPRIEAARLSLQDAVLVDADRLLAALGAAGESIDVLALAECPSTNALLRDNLQKNRGDAARTILCVADRQTAGRGRRGRAWVSTPEGSLTFSLSRTFDRGTDVSGLSLAVGLALRDGLSDCGVEGIMLKWPNDLLVPSGAGFAKLGGILVELAGDASGLRAVVGVGLNLSPPDGATLDQPAAGIDGLGEVPERHRLLAALVLALCRAFDDFARDGFLPLVERWNACHAFQGREVMLHADTGGALPARVLGVDGDGALRVRTANGETRWLAGDVSLRIEEGRVQ